MLVTGSQYKRPPQPPRHLPGPLYHTTHNRQPATTPNTTTMPCGTEHPTRENNAPALRAQLQTLHQLRAITAQYFIMIRDKEIATHKKKLAFVLKYNTWARQVIGKKEELDALL